MNGWVCEIHGGPCFETCGVGMPCPNPACRLSFDTETDLKTGLVRPVGNDEPWRAPALVLHPRDDDGQEA